MIVCIPGSWEDRSDFIRQVAEFDENGRYFYDGTVLADVREQDQVRIEFLGRHPRMLDAFYWRMIEPRKLKPGETFRLDDSLRHYRLELRPDRMNPPGDLFHNPYGLWHLALVAVG